MIAKEAVRHIAGFFFLIVQKELPFVVQIHKLITNPKQKGHLH